ncbi:MAG: transglutaminase family protein [Bacteroidota bacterium]
MAIRVALRHYTRYEYDRLVSLSPHTFRLKPAAHSRTPIEAYSLKITPENHFINWQQDPFGNYLARVVFPDKTREMSVEVEVIAEMVVINPFDFFLDEYAEDFPFEYDAQLRKELVPYLEITEAGPLLKQWLASVDRSKCRIVDFFVMLNQRVYQDIAYTVRMEPGVQTCEETLGRALGSCRDSGWLLVQIFRHLGLAARFVSGYLVQLTADIKSLDGPSGPEADFTDLHAWAEVYIPGAGWIGLDPTSGLFAGEGHIPLACTPDPVSAAPVTGLTDVCQTTFTFSNTVERIHEDPRVTKPYSEGQWESIVALGHQVDEHLQKGDVRMTMGGEPTFVSIDDMESAQWNTEADGVEKRKLSEELVRRLRDQFGPGGLLHYGQGKWYPGEVLPRWQLGLYWRKDGLPIWKNAGLLGGKAAKPLTHEDAHAFTEMLARHLGIQPNYAIPGYEDVFYFIWEEGKVPADIDPYQRNLKDPLERQRLAELLTQGLENPVGYALPLQWEEEKQAWQSSSWPFRRQQMFLTPGQSAMGMRLPLTSLPKADPKKEHKQYPRDLFAPVDELGTFDTVVKERFKNTTAHANATNAEVSADEIVRTSLCVEIREGNLFIFIPPVAYIEHYLDIIAAIEATAETLSIPVFIEGYQPPRDNRLQQLAVTPDPGVIEVNVQPATSWGDLLSNYERLYHQAHLSRLGTEKFMLDGRHTGTGGGNHITIGGAKPADSPLLRRPDLLRSLITYWQHHPGLSYLFASEFVGPTSQAPRVDEGRDEKLYELEIAFDQVPNNGQVKGSVEADSVPYWLVDRLFRHLLVDITGNTHRSEFCIDKLYSPDSSSGRLGILEFRAFDMPPHYRMSMVQMLLIRSLIAMFWEKPYKHKLVRWGTELHDRFMLSHYVHTDMQEVVNDLNRAGYPFQMSWLEPFFEFRFPVCGTLQLQNINLELRKAIEPWHVLGEEMSSGGTARFVDSSVERVQVKLTGLTDGRYALVCNGCRIPLNATGTKGEFVAGIRYRAWQPPSALHPTIGVDSPLVIDLVDTWNGRSIGGCTYHVVHPGGRSYETFPVNSYEAEARRVSRFWHDGHTPGKLEPTPEMVSIGRFFSAERPPQPMSPPEEIVSEEYPYTLDLRQFWAKK